MPHIDPETLIPVYFYEARYEQKPEIPQKNGLYIVQSGGRNLASIYVTHANGRYSHHIVGRDKEDALTELFEDHIRFGTADTLAITYANACVIANYLRSSHDYITDLDALISGPSTNDANEEYVSKKIKKKHKVVRFDLENNEVHEIPNSTDENDGSPESKKPGV